MTQTERAARDQRSDPDAPDFPVRTADCRVTTIERATHDTRIVRLAVEAGGPFDFAAGQYGRVAFPGFDPRDYSIASRPSDPELVFHIRDIGNGPSHFVATELEVGDPVQVRGPFGETYLRISRTGPIVAVGGGSGLGQMAAIVEEALARGCRQPVHLYFGARGERDVYQEDRMAALAQSYPNFRFVPVLSEPARPTDRRTGLVTDALAEDAPDLRDAVAYLAGPPPMVEAATRALSDLGVAAADIHADAFISEAQRKLRDGEV
jgi:CDP-4-dehydro-6-deoxyglucose reductase/ferredoxin-NAD(P)+ reductase (naphthalene dioxygenase ferredoxin-specific)